MKIGISPTESVSGIQQDPEEEKHVDDSEMF